MHPMEIVLRGGSLAKSAANDPGNGGIVVIGSGNWGTTLASVFAPNRATRLWTRDEEQAGIINALRINEKYLPDIPLPEALVVEPFGASGIRTNDIIIFAVPSHAVRSVAMRLQPYWDRQIIVSCVKGYELHNGHNASIDTPSEVLRDTLSGVQVIVLAGPNIAREIMEGRPARAVLAGKDIATLTCASRMLKNDRISFEFSRDVRGVELCSALKGIIAIAVGLGDGLQLGDNFTGLIVSYGLREFAAMGEFLGIAKETVYGIAGLGDCITSSLSPHGRNRTFGYLLGSGLKPGEALQKVGMVVEGVQMLLTIAELEDLNVPTPLFSALKEIIFKLFEAEAEENSKTNDISDRSGESSAKTNREFIRRHLVDTLMNYDTPVNRRIYALVEVA